MPFAGNARAQLAAAALLSTVPFASAAAASFTYTPLGLIGATITGLYQNQVVVNLPSLSNTQAYVWSNGITTALPNMQEADAVSDNGLVAGSSSISRLTSFSTYNLVSSQSNTVSYAGSAENIGIIGIDAAATVAGHAETIGGGRSFEQTLDGKLTFLDKVKQDITLDARGLDDSGAAILTGSLTKNGIREIYIYAHKQLAPFAIPGASAIAVTWVNGAGLFGGYYTNSANQQVGFTANGHSSLSFAAPNAVQTSTQGVGPAGQVMGNWTDSAGMSHGFIYARATYHSIEFPGATSTMLQSISATGSIAGYYLTPQNGTDAAPFIATCGGNGFCTN